MNQIFFLKNKILDYDWGSPSLIPNLLHKKNLKQKPQAELWMGSHPKSPSRIKIQKRWKRLDQWIPQKAASVLGASVALHFSNHLPFLFKVLAVSKPLSLQAHPDQKQAQAGFKQENHQGIPLHSPERNYKDPNPKPEILCALSEFWALCGFRKISQIAELVRAIKADSLSVLFELLKKNPAPQGLKTFFTALMSLEEPCKLKVIEEVSASARRLLSLDPVFRWIHELSLIYPKDIGVLAPLFLNLIRLEPGEALFLPPRELHSYLKGFGIELMGNSDNVLRGGLTSKHVDLPGLLGILNFAGHSVEILKPVSKSET